MNEQPFSRPDTLPVRIPVPRPIRQRFIRLNLMTARLWSVLYRSSAFSDLLEYDYVPPPELVHLPRWVVRLRDNTGLLWAFLTLPLMLLLIFGSAVFGATIAGAMIATQTANRLTLERSTRRFDLLAVTLRGGIGADLGFAVSLLHNNRRLTQVQSLFYVFCGILIALTIGLMMPVSNVRYETGAPLLVFNQLGEGLALGLLTLALYIEYRQSLLIGVMIGMLTPFLIRHETETHVLIPALFIALHWGVYVLLGVLALLLWNALHSVLFVSIVVCGLLFTSRELILRRLWAMVCQHLNTDDHALDELLKEYTR